MSRNRKVCGIGINDFEGKVSYIKNGKYKFLKSYSTWSSMILRCYSEKHRKKFPTYKQCSVSKEWLLYSNFKKWFDINYPYELAEEIRFDLDKDLLIEGNEIYSEESCLFLPKRVNVFMANKYSNNVTGYTGVSFHKFSKKFVANIKIFETKKYKNLGYFNKASEASVAYQIEREKMAELTRNYTKDLNMYSDEIINKIK